MWFSEYLDLQDNHAIGSINFYAMYSEIGDNVEGWNDPTVSIDEQTHRYSVYPNPASTTLNLNLPEAGTWEMVDLSGRQVVAPQRYPAGVNGIDLSGLPSGNYLMRNIQSPFSTVKVVKE